MIMLLSIIAVFLVLILPHEFGHFLVAKLSGMRVEKFSLGFGPKLWSMKRKGTEYLISVFPIGGYVKIAGMGPGEQEVEEGFYKKPLHKKIAVILSGSAMNFLFSLVLFSIIFMVGFQVANMEVPVVGEVIENSPAQQAGLKPGDRIVSIGGHQINEWQEIAQFVQQQEEEEKLEILVHRDDETLLFKLTPKYYPEYDRELIGISPSTKYVNYAPLDALKLGAERVLFVVQLIFRTLGGMIFGQVPAQLSGPVGIVKYVGQASQLGIIPFISLAAVLGVNLGLFNLFPIPALDGGRLVFLIVEGIRRKPVKIEFQEFVHYIGFIILIILMLLITYQDVTRLIP